MKAAKSNAPKIGAVTVCTRNELSFGKAARGGCTIAFFTIGKPVAVGLSSVWRLKPHRTRARAKQKPDRREGLFCRIAWRLCESFAFFAVNAEQDRKAREVRRKGVQGNAVWFSKIAPAEGIELTS